MHAPREPGDLPYAVGCPAFTRELRQVQWPSTKNFKPDVPEKYDGKMHPSEFLSIYTIVVQAAEVPHSALAARAPTPTSSLEA